MDRNRFAHRHLQGSCHATGLCDEGDPRIILAWISEFVNHLLNVDRAKFPGRAPSIRGAVQCLLGDTEWSARSISIRPGPGCFGGAVAGILGEYIHAPQQPPIDFPTALDQPIPGEGRGTSPDPLPTLHHPAPDPSARPGDSGAAAGNLSRVSPVVLDRESRRARLGDDRCVAFRGAGPGFHRGRSRGEAPGRKRRGHATP
jgi:hypothetical protein